MEPIRKSTLAFGVALSLLFGVGATLIAQEVRPAVVVPKKPVALQGQLIKVKGTDNLFIVRPKVGNEVRVVMTPESVVRLNNKIVKLDQVPEGAIVGVEYNEIDGKYVVATVNSPVVAPVVVDASAVGHVRGIVMEGDRPQPNLPVVLTAENGKIVANQRTRLDGTFVFDNVAPGVYKLNSDKSASKTVGEALVTVESGKVKEVAIELVRTPLP